MEELERFLLAFIPKLESRANWGRQLIRNEMLATLGDLDIDVPAEVVGKLQPTQRWLRAHEEAT